MPKPSSRVCQPAHELATCSGDRRRGDRHRHADRRRHLCRPAASQDFSSSFEAGDPQPTWTNTRRRRQVVRCHRPEATGIPGNVTDKVVEVTANGENAGPARSRRTSPTATSSRSGSSSSRPAGSQYKLSEPVKVVALRARPRRTTRPSATRRTGRSSGSNDGQTLDDARHAGRPGVQRALPDEAVPDRQHQALPVLPARHHREPRRRASSSSPSWQLSNGEVGAAAGPVMRSASARARAARYNAKTNVGFTGVRALQYGGEHTADGRGYSYNKVFDVDVAVTPATRALVQDLPGVRAATTCSYPSTYAAVDLAFTDGTYLSDLGAVDQHGATLSPQGQGASKTLYANQWNHKVSRIGDVAAGKTIDRILVAYDNPDGPADFGGWVDDIRIDGEPRAPAAVAPVRLGRHDPRHQLERQLLARQQHPRDRRPARLQLLGADDQRRLDELALRVPARQQRGQPADAPGVRGQPRAEPVDGRPPDVPGDAVGGVRHAGREPQRPRAAVPARERGRAARTTTASRSRTG